MRQPSLIRATLVIAAGLISHAALAQPPRHRGPPPEATAACQGLTEGQSCTVTFHDQQHAGTCRTGPEQQLACFPERMPPPPGGPGGRR